MPKSFRLNHVVGVDVVFLRQHNKPSVPFLNCVCWGTHYQMLQRIPTGKRKPHQVWRAFCRSWLRVFGVPEILLLDEGREFMAEFADRAATAAALVQTVDARSPWKNAKTERHGGHLKEI